MKLTPSRFHSRRGSVLIVALLFSGAIGISLATYLRMSRTTHVVSNRAFYNNAAMNIAEQGLEEAMYSVNKSVALSTYDWAGWTLASGDAKREWTTNVNLSQGTTATFRVYMYNYALANPAPKVVISRARVTLKGPNSTPVEKWIQVTLKKTSKFANGLVAKTRIDFNGNNASVDSWNSDPNKPSTGIVAYSTNAGVRRANGSVACNELVSVQNADVFGYVATGGTSPPVSSNGMITGDFNATGGTKDLARVDTNFNTSMDPVTAPTVYYTTDRVAHNVVWSQFTRAPSAPSDTTIPAGTTLPRTSGPTIDPVSYDGKYYIKADSANFNNAALNIGDKVVLWLTNSATAIDIGGGTGELIISSGASLEAYGSGTFRVTGQGILNGGTTLTTVNQPINCQFYGTKTSLSQIIDIKGQGVLSALVYAPFGTVRLNGDTDVCGSIVANDITVVGNASFHYDESLADFGVDSPYRLSNWKELTTMADRTATTAAVINW